VSFFYFASDGEDEYYLSRDGMIGYINLQWVTGQLVDTPTRGLPTRELDNSRMPPATLRA